MGVMERLGRDDVEYMETLFRVHSPAVRHVCLGRLKDPVAADDVVQEVFQRAAVNIDKLRENPLPWLLTVTTRLCVSEFRHRERVSGDLELATVQRPDDVARDPADEVVSSLTVDELMSCLTKAERKVVEAKCLDDMTHLEAGRSLGLSSGTTRQLMLRARRRMRAYAEDREIAGLGLLGDTGARLRGWWLRLRERAGGLGRHGTTAERLLAGSIPVAALAIALVLIPVGETSTGHPGKAMVPPIAVAPTAAPKALNVVLPTPRSAAPPIALRGPASRISDPLITLLAPHSTRPEDVAVTDMEVSPDYSQDHTILAVGNDSACPAIQSCAPLILSHDGGASWYALAAQAPAGTSSLLLPLNGFPRGDFYAVSSQIYLMSNWGKTSTPIFPAVASHASLVSNAARDVLTVSNNSLWAVNGSAPALVAAFPPGYAASDSSIYLPVRGGVYLQPTLYGVTPLQTAQVLTCATTCAHVSADLGWAMNTSLLASPQVATDGLVVAWSSVGIASSRDAGSTFSAEPLPAVGAGIHQLVLVPHGSGQRLVISYSTQSNRTDRVAYSDDLGATWREGASPVASGGSIRRMATITTDVLIAAAELPGDPGHYGFYCSYDGAASWGICISH